MIAPLKTFVRQRLTAFNETGVVKAYDLWADDYDNQPGNLMLDLDERIVATLLERIAITGKKVADIGCGTGRHWAQLLAKTPDQLTGFDVSAAMLRKLKQKYPSANVHTITDNRFKNVGNPTFDVVLSALTIAHIENLDEAIDNWCRILKTNADMVITDFHPEALAKGGKRTFAHRHKHITVKNYVHFTADVKKVLIKNGFRLVDEITVNADDTVKPYYEAKNALAVYEQFEKTPIIYGIHFRREQ
jgi:ubiquinone/menaquinone biosynthesis C-methylase UbiE